MSGLRRPKLVASVLFGNPNRRVTSDFWSTASDRSARAPWVDPAVFTKLHGFCTKYELEPVAVTPVGFSFAAPPDRLADVFSTAPLPAKGSYHPQRVGPRIVQWMPDQQPPPGAWDDLQRLGVAALEIGAAARGVGGPSRREVLWGAAAAGALGACQPVVPPWEATCGTASTGFPAGTAIPTEVGQLRDLFGLGSLSGQEAPEETRIIAVVDSGYAGDKFRGLERIGIADLDPEKDEDGHGTAVVDHLRAVAPGFRVRMSKYADLSGFRNYPVAAFQAAVQSDPSGTLPSVEAPNVVLCSWVMLHRSLALQREIADAVRRDIAVVFAAGNGRMADSAGSGPPPVFFVGQEEPGDVSFELSRRGTLRTVQAVAHPDVLSVGGVTAYCGKPEPAPSSVATSFDSELFPGRDGLPARHVPDVCGFVAPPQTVDPLRNPPALTLAATSSGGLLDRKPDGSPSGQVRTAGTSMAAAQVAGLVALLRDRHPSLTERAARNVILSTARALGDRWQPEVGFGLAAGLAPTNGSPGALDWLTASTPQALVRTTLSEGRRAVVVALADATCPDLVLRDTEIPAAEVDLRLGLAAKHVGDLDRLQPGVDHWVYVRFTNRSLVDHPGEVSLFSVRTVGGDYDLAELEIHKPPTPVMPGDFAVIAMPKSLPMDHDGLLVVVGDRPPELQPANVQLPADQVHALVLANSGLGLRRLA